ncbi:MAG: PEP-utilizing enzyme [bacterium]
MDKKLPKIMYDQSQFTSLWMIDQNGLWLCDEAYCDIGKNGGYSPSKWFVYTQNKPVSFWFGAYDQEALDKDAEVGFSNFTNKDFLNKFQKAIDRSYNETLEISKEFFNKFYNKEKECLENNPESVALFMEKIHAMSTRTMSYYFMTQPQCFFKFEEEIKPYALNKDIEMVSTNGRDLTFISKIHKFVVELAEVIKSSGETFDEFMVKNHEWDQKLEVMAETLGILNWGILGGELVDGEYVKREVNNFIEDNIKFLEEKRKISEILEHTKQRNFILENNDKKEFQIADIMGHSSVMRFDLQTFMMCVLNYANIFIKNLQEKHHLTNDQISSYYYDEIISLIREGKLVNNDILEKRQKGFLKVHKGEKVEVYLGEEAHAKIKDLLEFRLKEINETKEVKGTVASWPDKGVEKITARAFVLTTAFDSEEELKKFKDGDILVATQTHPNLVPQMKNAIAIIADEGGITCHAAIVSRELRKPCIIGTKLSTKIFKTGDNLELNLKTGRVRKV